MLEDNKLNYVVENGRRILDKESKVKMQKQYLEAGGLYPFELGKKKISKYGNMIKEINLSKPYIILRKKDARKSIFAILLLLINKKESKYVYYKITTSTHLKQSYLSGEYHDISDEFDNYNVLFVDINVSDIPHYYNSHVLRFIADLRYKKGLYTFFYFNGTMSDLTSGTWLLNMNESWRTGEAPVFEPITNYISYLDLKTGRTNEVE